MSILGDKKTDRMVRMEARLRSKQGVPVLFQNDAKKQKKGFLRLVSETEDGVHIDVLALRRRSNATNSGYEEEKMRCKDVAGFFCSTRSDLSAAIVLLGATRKLENRAIRMAPLRFTIDVAKSDYDASSLRDDLMRFLQGKGDVSKRLLTNLIPTEGLDMADQGLTFFQDTCSEDGVVGASSSRFPELFSICQQLFKVGESAALVAPAFTVFAYVVESYQGYQELKLKFIGLLSRWSTLAGYLNGEESLRRDLLALAEDFFFMPRWRQYLASRDFLNNVSGFTDKLDRAVLDRICMGMQTHDDKLNMILNAVALIYHQQNANGAPSLLQLPTDTPLLQQTQRRRQTMISLPSNIRRSSEGSVQQNSNNDEQEPLIGSAGDADMASSHGPSDISLSPLVSECFVALLSNLNTAKNASDKCYSMDIIAQLHQGLDSCDNATDKRKKEDEAEAVLLHVEALRKNTEVSHFLKTLQHKGLKEYARLLKRCGHVYRKVLSNVQASKAFYEDSLQVYQRMGEANRPSIAKTFYDLGEVNESLKEYSKAKDHYRNALKTYRQEYGENATRSEIASTLCCLGVVCEALGEYKEAQECYQHSLSMYQELDTEGVNRPKIAVMLRNLGNVYNSLRDYRKARDLYEEALTMEFMVYGDSTNRLDTAKTRYNLGLMCKSLEEYAQAKDHFENALKIYQAHGDDGLDTANTLYHLGRACKSLKEYEQALKHFEGALRLRRAHYGEDVNRSSIAIILHYQGRIYEHLLCYEQARNHFMEALNMRRALHGNDLHPEVKESLRDMERIGTYILCVDLN